MTDIRGNYTPRQCVNCSHFLCGYKTDGGLSEDDAGMCLFLNEDKKENDSCNRWEKAEKKINKDIYGRSIDD